MKNCKYCNKNIETVRYPDRLGGSELFQCPTCGRYFIADYSMFNADKHKTSSYLFYNKHKNPNWTIFLGDEKQFESYKIARESDADTTLVTNQMVEEWYPKTFKEKIELILLKMANLSVYEGAYIKINDFADKLFFCKNIRAEDVAEGCDIDVQIQYMTDYLVKNELLVDVGSGTYQLTPKAYERIYTLQKYNKTNKNVFVAMKFGKETQQLREKIKEGLSGFNVRIMDEIEHNHQIVPEMLYEIKNSKFVIAELSHHNNGAYYEAGYALGLGKEVIHLCNREELASGLHFDVKQINTIVYENIDEIPEKLKKRIEATIQY